MAKFYPRSLWLLALLFSVQTVWAQTVPTPKSHFGFDIGDDYQLANYTQTEAYFKKLAASSNRVKLVEIGKTEEGRSQYMLIVTSPENQKNLEKYKEISQKLAHAEDLTKEQAKALAAEGKAVVWIDGGLHANEVVGAHQLIQMAYNLASRTDAETTKILDKVIILMTHANPDGQELVSDWYMREKDPKKRSINGLPRLYEKYAGHDNNRDFFMLNLKETQNMGRQLFVEWIPQIMYNHHQAGPAGTVVAGPPYRDPYNYVFDPIILTSIDAVGAAMHNRMNVEAKPGYTQRGGSVFSTWYNGGLRTTTYFHNMIGLLTEIVGSPTPSDIPLVPSRLLPNGDSPNPVLPQKWYFKNSIDYSISLNYAVLNYAQRYSDELLYNIYQMGRNSIERGSKDTWSFSPKKIDAINEAYQKDKKATTAGPGGDFNRGGMPVKYLDTIMKAPKNRDARGYILSADQQDFTTAIRFLNALIRTGIRVQKATAPFTVAGKSYPAGSYVVKTDQAFRPHVLDMFEPQDHPNDFKYEGGPPIAPYDAAGWTLAYLMNVKFDRILEPFDGPFEKLPYGELIKATPKALPSGSGYVLSAKANESFLAVNELLKGGAEVYRNTADGSFYVPASAKAKSILDKAEHGFGMRVMAAQKPAKAVKIAPARIALWDTYGGSMDSGWIRFIMEQYHFDATVIYAPDIDAGNLKDKYDVIVFVDGSIPAFNPNPANAGGRGFGGPAPETVPEQYRARIGRMSQEKSIPQLKKFLEAGGEIVAIGSATNLAAHLDLPVRNAIVELVGGVEKRLPAEKYYVPGSVLNVALDSKQPANWGMDSTADVYFDNSPVFKLSADAVSSGKIKPLAWFANATPLRSGWAWGQSYLQDGVTAFEADYGKGKLFAFGPEITFRAQTHGTFKWMFNQLYK
ncbi:M14 metallopeptidase family protein [Pedobacter sp. KR3-3]|uniref:M14 metallopeptidase family protein n=1 Tax=Pedobacter albus TaxID=3113905 RepID=A0ABU7ICV3_9SPHI|nr:M14 metallopeptidase family protein [Pedobacter sp. KR3-3]MEE1947315.1 M14 metallopeptidase family protein [Pedobacter sp. KR3-3]